MSYSRRSDIALVGPVLMVALLVTTVVIAREALVPPRGELWVADGNTISSIEPASGRTRTHIGVGPDFRAFAVDPHARTVWALAGTELRGYAESGELRHSAALSVAPDGHAMLAVEPQSGRLWLATDAEVFLFDADGRAHWSRPLRGPVLGISPDLRRSWLWVATPDQVSLLDEQGRLIQQINFLSAGVLRAIEYDPVLDQVWAVSDLGVRRMNWEGKAVAVDGAPPLRSAAQIATDRHGGLWVAADGRLLHFDGSSWFESVRFGAADADRIVDLFVDVGSRSVWAASSRQLARYGASAVLLERFDLPSPRSAAPWVKIAGLNAPVCARPCENAMAHATPVQTARRF